MLSLENVELSLIRPVRENPWLPTTASVKSTSGECCSAERVELAFVGQLFRRDVRRVEVRHGAGAVTATVRFIRRASADLTPPHQAGSREDVVAERMGELVDITNALEPVLDAAAARI